MAGFVRARIDESLKAEAATVLEAVGLTVSDAIRMLLTRIAKEKALPIELVIPNANTIAAMEEAQKILDERTARFKHSTELFNELKKDTAKGP